MKSESYHSFDPIGSRIWELLQEPKAVHEICDTLLMEHDIERDCCERDLSEFLQGLAAKGSSKLSAILQELHGDVASAANVGRKTSAA